MLSLRVAVAKSLTRRYMPIFNKGIYTNFSTEAVQDVSIQSEIDDHQEESLSEKAFIIEPIGEHKITLVWLQGLGDLKTNFKHIFDMLALKHTRLVVPESPQLPVSAFEDKIMPTWFDLPKKIDRYEDPLQFEDDRIGILLAAHSVFGLLNEEQQLLGGDSKKLILGGASLGGTLAIHAGLRHKQTLGGIISVSGYASLLNEYPKFLRKPNRETNVLAIHGFEDHIIPVEFARTSYQHLKNHGVKLSYLEDRDMDNRLGDRSVFFLKKWIQEQGGLISTKPTH